MDWTLGDQSAKGSPVIHVYALCHNEEILLPYFLRHYGSFAENIVIFDGASTDRSSEIIDQHPRAVRVPSDQHPSHPEGKYSELVLMSVRNEAYKKSRGKADWVMIVDIDEFIYHPRLLDLLKSYKENRITLPGITGYEMVADDIPRRGGQIYEELRLGFKNYWYSKKAVFAPEIDINYKPGCHLCNPAGEVVESPTPELKLLHYRLLGPDYFVMKYNRLQKRMSVESRVKWYGMILSVPGPSSKTPLFPATEEDLAKRFHQAVSEQPVEEVVP